MIGDTNRRAVIDRIIKKARTKALIKGRGIETIDPLVSCARRLFPHMPDESILELARTALRVIQAEYNLNASSYRQTTLVTHFLTGLIPD